MSWVAAHIGFLMDVAVLILLAATIAVAFRLMRDLRDFREGRAEMRVLVTGLSANIMKAEDIIGLLNRAASNAAMAAKPQAEEPLAVSLNAASGTLAHASADAMEEGSGSTFVILDRVYDDRTYEEDAEDEDAFSASFHSRAERELLEALENMQLRRAS